jgi:hypothetical protein
MSIDVFGVERFDAALEVFPTAKCIGQYKGEYVWVVPVVSDRTIGVIVRSTIREDGVSAGSGEDSIRAWIGRIPDGAPWAPKVFGRWTTRTPGWESRLRQVIEELISLSRAIRACPRCGAWLKLSSKGGVLQLRCDGRMAGFLDFTDAGVPLEIPGERCGHEEPIREPIPDSG